MSTIIPIPAGMTGVVIDFTNGTISPTGPSGPTTVTGPSSVSGPSGVTGIASGPSSASGPVTGPSGPSSPSGGSSGASGASQASGPVVVGPVAPGFKKGCHGDIFRSSVPYETNIANMAAIGVQTVRSIFPKYGILQGTTYTDSKMTSIVEALAAAGIDQVRCCWDNAPP